MAKNPYFDALTEVSDAVQAKADAAALRELIARNRSYSRQAPPAGVPGDEAGDGELLRELIRANREQQGAHMLPPLPERVLAVTKVPAPAKAPAWPAWPARAPAMRRAMTPGLDVYAATETSVFSGASILDQQEAENLLLAGQVIALANRLVTRIWHNGNDHSEIRRCQNPECQFKAAISTPAWRYETVRVVLEWRRVATFPHVRPSWRLFGPETCRRVEMLQNGVPLTEYVGNLPQLWENLDRIAQAVSLDTGHLAWHIRNQIIGVAQAAAVSDGS